MSSPAGFRGSTIRHLPCLKNKLTLIDEMRKGLRQNLTLTNGFQLVPQVSSLIGRTQLLKAMSSASCRQAFFIGPIYRVVGRQIRRVSPRLPTRRRIFSGRFENSTLCTRFCGWLPPHLPAIRYIRTLARLADPPGRLFRLPLSGAVWKSISRAPQPAVRHHPNMRSYFCLDNGPCPDIVLSKTFDAWSAAYRLHPVSGFLNPLRNADSLWWNFYATLRSPNR